MATQMIDLGLGFPMPLEYVIYGLIGLTCISMGALVLAVLKSPMILFLKCWLGQGNIAGLLTGNRRVLLKFVKPEYSGSFLLKKFGFFKWNPQATYNLWGNPFQLYLADKSISPPAYVLNSAMNLIEAGIYTQKQGQRVLDSALAKERLKEFERAGLKLEDMHTWQVPDDLKAVATEMLKISSETTDREKQVILHRVIDLYAVRDFFTNNPSSAEYHKILEIQKANFADQYVKNKTWQITPQLLFMGVLVIAGLAIAYSVLTGNNNQVNINWGDLASAMANASKNAGGQVGNISGNIGGGGIGFS